MYLSSEDKKYSVICADCVWSQVYFKPFGAGNDCSVKILNLNYDFNERGRKKLFDKMICPFTKAATGRAARTRKISDKIKSSK